MTPAQSNIEYGLLIATISILVLLGAAIYGSVINYWFEVLLTRITST